VLGERFADSAQRGERLHLQEEARYLLELKGDARAALAAASENWKAQREPRDAAILLKSALAPAIRARRSRRSNGSRRAGFESRTLHSTADALKAAAR
jgi:hypothetical protein